MSISVRKVLAVTSGAYTIGDVVGGLITFSGLKVHSRHLIVNSVKLYGVAALPYNLWFLNADLATPAVADNEPFTTVEADGALCEGVVPIAASDYVAPPSSFNLATVRQAGLQVQLAEGSEDLYAYLVAAVTTTPGTTRLDLEVDFEALLV